MDTIKKRKLGKTGLEVSEIGFGAWGIGGNSKAYGVVDLGEVEQCITKYIENGGNFVDTASVAVYGQSEEILGNNLWKHCPREKIVLCTKVVCDGEKENIPMMRTNLEKSLRLLKTDYIDVYYLHMPPAGIDAMKRSLEQYEIFKAEGKIHFTGASVKGPDVTQATLDLTAQYADTGMVDVFQLVYSILRQKNAQMFKTLADKGFGIIGRTSLESGLLTGKYKKGHAFGSEDHRNRFMGNFDNFLEAIDELEKKAIISPFETISQVAIKFSVMNPYISSVLVGAKTTGQINQNLTVASLPDIQQSIYKWITERFENCTEMFNTVK